MSDLDMEECLIIASSRASVMIESISRVDHALIKTALALDKTGDKNNPYQAATTSNKEREDIKLRLSFMSYKKSLVFSIYTYLLEDNNCSLKLKVHALDDILSKVDLAAQLSQSEMMSDSRNLKNFNNVTLPANVWRDISSFIFLVKENLDVLKDVESTYLINLEKENTSQNQYKNDPDKLDLAKLASDLMKKRSPLSKDDIVEARKARKPSKPLKVRRI